MNVAKVSALSHLFLCLSEFLTAYCMQLFTGLYRVAKNIGIGIEHMCVEFLPPLLLYCQMMLDSASEFCLH